MTENNDLISQEVRSLLDDLVAEMGIIDDTITITEGTVRGDNYLGIIAKAVVSGRDSKSKENVKLQFIIKSAPRQGIVRNMGTLHEAYKREIYVYSKVLPEFLRLQEERGILNRFESYAKYYSSSMADKDEALIMHDMKSLGYRLCNRRDPLNHDHVLLVMREYGRFHAISFAMRDQKPELFDELAENMHERLYRLLKDNKDVNKGIQAHAERALKAFDPIRDRAVYERFKTFQENCLGRIVPLLEPDAAGEYGVLSHGDNWINNMLFKYGDCSTPDKPTQVCFLDWQLAQIGSPALDLSYFLFTCTDKKLRNANYHLYLKEYHDSLSTFLRELRSDPIKLFPFEVLQKHLKQFSTHGLYMAVMVLHFMMSEADEVPDFHDGNEEIIEKFNYETKNVDKYHARIRDVVYDFVNFEYDF